MGLFSRKKKLTVPLPPSEDLLRFPKTVPPKREIIPEKIKIDTGLPEEPHEDVALEKPALPRSEDLPPKPLPPVNVAAKPVFLRVQQYQEVIEGLAYTKSKVNELEHVSHDLQKSEFNENRDYERLKNELKRIHDRLLAMDDIIFKK